VLTLSCALLSVQVHAAGNDLQATSQPVNAVIEWNRTLLLIVRTPGAQPATIHSTRNFAILHAAIYDAIANIEPHFSPHLVSLPNVNRNASTAAAADAAAHDVLVSLYPTFRTSLDTELQQHVASLPANDRTSNGLNVGQAVAAQLLGIRASDGA